MEVALAVENVSAVFRISNSFDPRTPPDAARLFARFYRADKSRGRNKEGVDLGLSLAREIFRAHGGDLRSEFLASDRIAFVGELPLSPASHAS